MHDFIIIVVLTVELLSLCQVSEPVPNTVELPQTLSNALLIEKLSVQGTDFNLLHYAMKTYPFLCFAFV